MKNQELREALENDIHWKLSDGTIVVVDDIWNVEEGLRIAYQPMIEFEEGKFRQDHEVEHTCCTLTDLKDMEPFRLKQVRYYVKQN
jgi:hypoxanthine phosphoribosyltransferase